MYVGVIECAKRSRNICKHGTFLDGCMVMCMQSVFTRANYYDTKHESVQKDCQRKISNHSPEGYSESGRGS